jgi:aminoglycoside phosphotransferase family enzyme
MGSANDQDPRIPSDLARPAAFPERTAKVELVQTHISFVFVADEHVYKVKKAVDFGFLDFSTRERRRRFCEAEVELNARLSPHVYLGVVPVTERQGRLVFGGRGEPRDWAVRMRRIPMGRLMSALLAQGIVGPEDMSRVAEAVARFHRGAATSEAIARFGSLETVRTNTDENFAQTAGYVGRTITRAQYDALRGYTERFLGERAGLLEARAREGFVRDCHGDLHTEHVVLTDPVTVFDCIEFNERFRYSDTAADIAFLAMDLDFHGRRDLSRTLVERYVAASGDAGALELLDFYKVYRAYVRGKVVSFRLDDAHIPPEEKERARATAARYFELALSYVAGGQG